MAATDTTTLTESTAEELDLPKPTQGDLEVELGVPMAMPFAMPAVLGGAGWQNRRGDEQILFRNQEPTVQQLVEMRRKDGQARALYRLLTLPIRAALQNCSFIPAEGDTGEAEFIENMMTLPSVAGGMKINFHRVVAQALMAIFDGFSAFEQVYWVPSVGPLKGKVTLKKLAFRPADTVYFIIDPNGNYRGFQQKTVFQGRPIDVYIAPENSFYYAANEEESPFYGVSYFESAFYHYDKKVKLYYLAHLAAQNRAVGVRIGKMPAGADMKTKQMFRTALSNFGIAQAMLVPDGYSVEELAKSAQNFDYLPLIEHHDQMMSRSVLAMFLDDDKSSRLVDFSSQKDDMFILMEHSIMDELAATFNNYLFPKFIDWNFGSGCYPEFQWGAFTEEQKAAIRVTFNALAIAQQTNVSPEFMFELEKLMAEQIGLEIDYQAIEERLEAKIKLESLQDQNNIQNEQAGGAAVTGIGPGGKPVGGAPSGGQRGPTQAPTPFNPSTPRADTNPSATSTPAGATQGAAGGNGGMSGAGMNPTSGATGGRMGMSAGFVEETAKLVLAAVREKLSED